MLESLSAIDWSKLHHAYGTAEDVPDQLRALISPDAKQRDDALYELFGNIHHQSTIYEATAYAVPFMFEILSGSAACDRTGIVNLIGAIANGGGYHGLNPTPQESVWIAKCRSAVRKGLNVVQSQLQSEDASLRILCAYVLASYPEDAERSRPALRAALQRETEVERRAGLGMAVMLLGEPAPDAFVSATPTPLPLARLEEFVQRAIDGLTERAYALDLIFECALTQVDVDTIAELLDDRERWGGEDDI